MRRGMLPTLHELIKDVFYCCKKGADMRIGYDAFSISLGTSQIDLYYIDANIKKELV